MSNLEQQCSNILAQAQSMLLRDKWSSAYNGFVEAFALADAHYQDAPLHKKISTVVCYRVFKAYLYGATGLVRMREKRFDAAIEQLTKGLALCPHDALLQRLVLANLQLGFVSEAHRYLRMLHNPPITNDSILFTLGYNIHVPSPEIHSLEAILYIRSCDINRAIASCFTGMSLLAEELKGSCSDTLYDCTDPKDQEALGIHDIQQNNSTQQTTFQRRVCVHCLSLCETMKMAAEIGLAVPYSVDGSIELVLESLFSNVPSGIVEGNRILDFSLLSSFAFMAFVDKNGDVTLPGRGVAHPEMLVNIFSMNFRCGDDVFAVPSKITPFLSLNLFSDTIRTELATYSEAYKKAVIDHGVALLDRQYLIIKPSILSKYIERTYGTMHFSIPSLIDNHENGSIGNLHSDTYSRRTVDTRAGRHVPITSASKIGANANQHTAARAHNARSAAKNPTISYKNYHSSRSSQSIVSTTHTSVRKKNTTRRRVTSVKQVMDRFESGPTGPDSSSVLSIVVKNAKEHREDLSFLPHSDIKAASTIKEIDNVTQVTLQKIDTMNGFADGSPKMYNLYTNKISTCHECSYSTPTFATRKLRDEEDKEGVINLCDQTKATNSFRNISLRGVYKNQLEKSMSGTLRERMFIEMALERVENGSLDDFSFLKAENFHLINRNILCDGSIAINNLSTSKNNEKTTVKDSAASPLGPFALLAQSLREVRFRPERSAYTTYTNRPTPLAMYAHSKIETTQSKHSIESMLQNNELTDTGSCYTDDQLSLNSFVQGASVANYSVNASNYMTASGGNQIRTSVMSGKSVPLRSIPGKYVKKLVEKSSKKASISRNTAYQQLREENRLGLEAGDTDNKDPDESDAEELAKQRCELYVLITSNSPSPDLSPSPGPSLRSEINITAGELINEPCFQRISTNSVRSETAILAENILSSKGASTTHFQPSNLLTNLSKISTMEHTIENNDLTTLHYPTAYTNSEEFILPPMPQQDNFSPDTRASLKNARDDFYGSRVASQGLVNSNAKAKQKVQNDKELLTTAPAIAVQPSENFGYLIDTLHINDISEHTVTDPCPPMNINTSMLINTTKLPCPDNLLMRVELGQSASKLNLAITKDTEDDSFPAYKGTMHVSVRLGAASSVPNTHQSKLDTARSKSITNYHLAIIDDEYPNMEEKDKLASFSTDTMTLTSEPSDVTGSPVSTKVSPLNDAVVEKQVLHIDSTNLKVIDSHFEETVTDRICNVHTLHAKDSKIPSNSLRINMFSDISGTFTCIQHDRGSNTDDVASPVPTLEVFTSPTLTVAPHIDATLIPHDHIDQAHGTQSVPKIPKTKRKTVPLSTVLTTDTTDAAEPRISRMRSVNVYSIRPSLRSRK